MIFSNAFPEVPVLDVTVVGGEVPSSQIAIVDLTFSENKHDIATITYAGFPGIAVTSYVGLPVQIKFGNNESNLVDFVGYVAYVEIEANTRMGITNDSLIQMAKVVCFGSSYQMKPIRSTAYTNKTIKQIVEIFANKYNFSYSVPNNNYVFSNLNQNQQSDWEMLVGACNKLGYSVTAHGTHIAVYDNYSSYYRGLPETVLYTLEDSKGTERRAGNIYEFNGFFGDITPHGQSSAFVFNSLDNIGKENTYTSTENSASGLGAKLPARFTHQITTNTVSKNDLEQALKQYTRKTYPMTATAKVIGVSSAMPGRLAKVQSYNSAFDGYWLIEEARHEINAKHYITTLKLKTDSTNGAGLATNKGSGYTSPPSSRLSNNLWQTERELANVY